MTSVHFQEFNISESYFTIHYNNNNVGKPLQIVKKK